MNREIGYTTKEWILDFARRWDTLCEELRKWDLSSLNIVPDTDITNPGENMKK